MTETMADRVDRRHTTTFGGLKVETLVWGKSTRTELTLTDSKEVVWYAQASGWDQAAIEGLHEMLERRWVGRECEARETLLVREIETLRKARELARGRVESAELRLREAKEEVEGVTISLRTARERLNGLQPNDEALEAGRAAFLRDAGLGAAYEALPAPAQREEVRWVAGSEVEDIFDGEPRRGTRRFLFEGTGRTVVVAGKAVDALAYVTLHPEVGGAHMVVEPPPDGKGEPAPDAEVDKLLMGSVGGAVRKVLRAGEKPRVVVALGGSREESMAAGVVSRFLEREFGGVGLEVERHSANQGWFQELQIRRVREATDAGRVPDPFASIMVRNNYRGIGQDR